MQIPASQIVNVTPGVLSPGGLGLSLNGVILTESTQVPIDVMEDFVIASDVAAYFGPNSPEYGLAATYFQSFDNSNIKPGNLFFAQYPGVDVAAYMRGGPLTSLSIAQINALATGSLTVLLDGYTHTAASINLAGATSYSNVAAIIQTALFASEPTEATSSAATIAGTVLTVGGTVTGTFAVGQTVTGSGVTADSVIVSLGTGVGGVGTYNLSESSTVASPIALTAVATAGTVAFDSVSGALVFTSGITGVPSTAAFATGTLAIPLFLTSVSGAVLSQGAAATTPSAFMTNLMQIRQDWAVFMTLFDPDGGSGNTVKLAFAQWTSQQNGRWNYACWDTDASAATQNPATGCLGQLLKAGNYSGTTPIWRTASLGDADNLAAFYAGAAAAINFTQQAGRITFAFKGQTGITPDVTNATQANNLIANGYNFYADYGAATQQFLWFYPGQISGPFAWADAYCNQIWLTTSFQTSIMNLFKNTLSIPYTTKGYALIEAAVQDVINAGLNFGAFSPGVPLSQAQQAEVINAAGVDITAALFAQGYYFQILPAAATTRAARQSPPCTFWYTDAGAVQKINLNSIAVQ